MTRAERVLLALLCASALFAPIFLGGVGRFEIEGGSRDITLLDRFLLAHGPWSILTFLAVATAAASVAVAQERRCAGEPPPWRLHPDLLLPVGGLAVMALLQLVPLPRGGSWRPLTFSPEGTRNFLAGLGVGGAALLGTLLVARRRAAATALMGTIVVSFAAAGLYGLWEHWSGSNRVLEYERGAGAGLSGTFINKSHMAAAAGMGLPLALALGWSGIRRVAGGKWTSIAVPILALGAAAVFALVIPLTHARMGLAAGAFGLGAFGLLSARAVRWPAWARAAMALVFLLAVAGGLKAAWDRVPAFRQRFQLAQSQQGFFDVRFPAWKSTVELASRHPVLGTGLGSYEVAIHETQSPANRDEIIHAHSEPLEFLSDGGLIGFALAIFVALAAAKTCLRLAGADDPGIRLAACACGGALAALLAGCSTEFHLRIPALGIAAAILAGVPAALGAGEPPTPTPRKRGLFEAILLALVLFGGLAAAGQSRAAAAEGAAVLAEKAGTPGPWLEAARHAVDASGSAASHRSLSGALLAGEWEGPEFPERAAEALVHADVAVDLEPCNAYSHWSRARALLALGRYPEAADAIARCRARAGGIGHLLGACGTVLLELSTRDPSLLEPGLLAIREAGNCDPHHWTNAGPVMERLKVPPALQAEAIPELWYSLEKFLDEARARGDIEAQTRLQRRIGER